MSTKLDTYLATAPKKLPDVKAEPPNKVPDGAIKPVVAGCCMFASKEGVHPLVDGCICSVNRIYCPPSIFAVREVFLNCTIRNQKLKEQT